MDEETKKEIEKIKNESDDEIITNSFVRAPWEVDPKENYGYDFTSLYNNEMLRRLKDAILNLKKTTSFYSKILTFLTIIMTFAVIATVFVPFYIDSKNKNAELNKKITSINLSNKYNKGILYVYMNDIEKEILEQRIVWGEFTTETYKQNWETISNLPDGCEENYLELIGKMVTINMLNDFIMTMKREMSLVSEENQKMHIYNLRNNIYPSLKAHITETKEIFNKIDNCQ